MCNTEGDSEMSVNYTNKNGEFVLENADQYSYLYFPIANEAGVMSSITPTLHGDSKMNQNTFFLEPVSNENLHATSMNRNFWLRINDETFWNVAGNSPWQQASKNDPKAEDAVKDKMSVRAGKLYHELTRKNEALGIKAVCLSYCPVHVTCEIMKVTVTNESDKPMTIGSTVAIPIYGRSADNYRDHRNVTSLLHRTQVVGNGIVTTPALSFDERGHIKNKNSYGVHATDEQMNTPVAFYPVMEEYIGEGGYLTAPKAVISPKDVKSYNVGDNADGFEAIGAMSFAEVTLAPGEAKTYRIILSYNGEGLEYLEASKEKEAFEEMLAYWEEQSTVTCHTGNDRYDTWLQWVSIQPTLRRIYGCSFLPHHDYGRGGRGYRDLWQDCLALQLMSPISIRESLISYYGGVRMDGSNATIIGSKPGEFIADRNSIIRVWMDHGLWPYITTNLYINQTGDLDILLEPQSYFKDAVSHRGRKKDGLWNGIGHVCTIADTCYKGTVLEHILLQHLTVFYDVGEHGHMLLRGADWNDALDMAKEKGESVAFTAAYAGNLKSLAALLLKLKETKNISTIEIASEMEALLFKSEDIYKDPKKKMQVLDDYCNSCTSYVSGKKANVLIEKLAEDLNKKADSLVANIQKKEWVTDGKGKTWLNSYYDDHARQVEGVNEKGVRMMLTGQVFSIMSKTATDEQVSEIVKAVDEYLYCKEMGGYKLNTDFHELKEDLGRMFGFAYGHKENGAVFCHMAVMYANALYQRGFAKEGFKVISSLYEQADDFDRSVIYPGIPEYYNIKGRGMYSYLTGAASWFMMTVINEMFGVKGRYGDLALVPQLLKEQFDEEGIASIELLFAGKKIKVVYENTNHKEIGDYEVDEVYLNDELIETSSEEVVINKELLEKLSDDAVHTIRVRLA